MPRSTSYVMPSSSCPLPLVGVAAGACLVFEDAPAGIVSARAAGVRHVVGVTLSHEGVDSFLDDLRSVSGSGDLVRLAQ